MSIRDVSWMFVCVACVWTVGCGDEETTGSPADPAGGSGQGDGGGVRAEMGVGDQSDMGAGVEQDEDMAGGAGMDAAGSQEADMVADQDAGGMVQADMADPCAQVVCGENAQCVAGTCACDAGFVEGGDGMCVVPKDTDPKTRTKAQLCARWNKDYPPRATTQWKTEPSKTCDVGELHPEYLQDAVRRTSLFRWLVGLEPVSLGTEYTEEVQHCATAIAALGKLTHNIAKDAECSTALARSGAGSSNIASGQAVAASTVNLYVHDPGAANAKALGHRRWIFNPKMGKTSFGQRDRFSCMKAFDQSNRKAPAVEYVAWPPPGPSPYPFARGIWSFSTSTYTFDGETKVKVKDLVTGTMVDVGDAYRAQGNYGGVPALAWNPPKSQLEVGSRYEVTLSGLKTKPDKDSKTVTYTVEVVNCR